VVVGVHRGLAAQNAAHRLRSPVGDHLIHVLLVLGARSRLPTRKGKYTDHRTAAHWPLPRPRRRMAAVCSGGGADPWLHSPRRKAAFELAERPTIAAGIRSHSQRNGWRRWGPLRPSSAAAPSIAPRLSVLIRCCGWRLPISRREPLPLLSSLESCGVVLRPGAASDSRPVASRRLCEWRRCHLAAVSKTQHHRGVKHHHLGCPLRSGAGSCGPSPDGSEALGGEGISCDAGATAEPLQR